MDVAKVVLHVAKVVLDVVKVVLDVAKVVLHVAKVVLHVAKVVLHVAKVVLHVAKVVLDGEMAVLVAVANAVLDVVKAVLDGVQHRHHNRHLPIHHRLLNPALFPLLRLWPFKYSSLFERLGSTFFEVDIREGSMLGKGWTSPCVKWDMYSNFIPKSGLHLGK
ncbi:hypothetical protein EMCRGX_G021490 [Ephydatia muelleri]